VIKNSEGNGLKRPKEIPPGENKTVLNSFAGKKAGQERPIADGRKAKSMPRTASKGHIPGRPK